MVCLRTYLGGQGVKKVERMKLALSTVGLLTMLPLLGCRHPLCEVSATWTDSVEATST